MNLARSLLCIQSSGDEPPQPFGAHVETFNQLIQAKSQRDTVRDAIIRALRGVEGLPADLLALLAADTQATDSLKDAVKQHNETEH